jgi:hypothetical protein
MLELYVADNFLRYAGNEGGYDIDPTVPIYQVEHPSNPEMISLKETPLPEHIKATSIYSCMDYSVKLYSNGFLGGATNVVVCPDGNHTPTADHPFDEVINEVSFHWSLYYHPFVIDRIIKGLE